MNMLVGNKKFDATLLLAIFDFVLLSVSIN